MMSLLTALVLATGSSNICTSQSCVVYAETATDLYQIDPTTLVQTHLCTFAIPSAVNDIAVDLAGTVYALTATDLYTVNPNGCASTHLATVAQALQAFNGLTFLIDGRMIAADANGDVDQIDPSTGAVTSVGSYGSNFGCSGDLVSLSDGTIYGTAKNLANASANDYLVTLDPTSFAATQVAQINDGNVYGLAYWAGVLYGFDGQGNTLTIDPTTAQSSVVNASPSISWFGAGTTPLAPTQCIQQCTPGSTQCDPSGNLQTCTEVAANPGCYNWLSSPCGAGQACTGGACAATCSSNCVPLLNQPQCVDATDVETCNLQSNGCWDWTSAACPSGQACSSGQCGTTCTDACTPGAAQCSSSQTLTCAAGPNGCTVWQPGSDCGAAGCVGGACCPCAPGQSQCAADGSLQTCQVQTELSGVCPAWVSQPCTTTCQQGVCLTPCSPSAEIGGCPAGATCVAMAGGYYCGGLAPDGGGTPLTSASSSAGSSAATSSGSGGASVSATATSTSGTAGASGTTTGGAAGGAAGATAGTAASAGSAAGSTSGNATAAAGGGQSAGSSAGRSATATGCGCGSSGSAPTLEIIFVAFLLEGLRRRHGQPGWR